MSHVTDVKMRVRDIDALQEAVEAIGGEFRRDQKTHAWWGTFVGDSNAYGELKPEEMGRCAHAIRMPGTSPKNGSAGPWEVGIYPSKDGDGFKVYYDTFGGAGNALTALVGPGASRLKQEYTAAVIAKQAKAKLARKGFTVSREALAGGRIRMRVRQR